MARQRSRRLRKKMHIDEFQELGFSVAWTFPDTIAEDDIDAMVDALIIEVIEPNGLAFDGSGYRQWEGLVCMQQIGKCTDAHRERVVNWLKEHKLESVQVSELFDVWWD